MIDITVLRTDPDRLRASLAERGMDLDVDRLVALDEEVRALRHRADELRAEQKGVGQSIRSLEGAEKEAAITRAGGLADECKALAARADELDAEFRELWIQVPNFAHETAARGLGEEDNAEMVRVGEPPEFEGEPLDHLELGESLGIIDVESAARVSGSRFAFLKGQAVFLEFALVRFALDVLADEGFLPVIPPVLVREEALFGTGFFPEARDQVYAVPEDDLFLVGTAEVPLASLHVDEILERDQLPIRYAGFSTCFRREAGSYGRDTRGIFRVHQFDKVEMFSFVLPEDSWDEHEYLHSIERRLVDALELPYRVVNVAAGDLGASAAKKYDIEAWIPSQGAYREITSCSNTTDFQSRRLRIRTRGEQGTEFVHTLNGTAIAIGRTILALLENHQQPDGTVAIPEALVPYTGFERLGA
ncbi:MAG: serine--tRNA ligase [Acidimicrobiia bacterium]